MSTSNVTAKLQTEATDDPELTVSLTMRQSVWALLLDVLDVGAADPDAGGLAKEEDRQQIREVTGALRDEFDLKDQIVSSLMRYVRHGEPAYYPLVTTLAKKRPAARRRG